MQRLQDEKDDEETRQQEDVVLQDMSTLLHNLGYQAVTIQGELADQDKMLTKTINQTEVVQDKINVANTRIDKLNAKLSECFGCGSLKNQLCALGILLFIILILLFLIVET
jgi:hypothetical protein